MRLIYFLIGSLMDITLLNSFNETKNGFDPIFLAAKTKFTKKSLHAKYKCVHKYLTCE